MGAVGDRRWMLVDMDGRYISQREIPRLAHIQALLPTVDGSVLHDGPLHLSITGKGDCAITVQRNDDSTHTKVSIWNDSLEVADAGDYAAEWCSDAIGKACRLVHCTKQSFRPLAAKYSGPLPHEGRFVSVTDGAPLLILGQGSLNELNRRFMLNGLPTLGIERFRPNILISNTLPHEEDTWLRIRISDNEIGVGSPCPRCVITTIDQSTLDKSVEPLRMLSSYRRQKGGVMFGMNATHLQKGEIHVGDLVTVLECREL